MDGLPAAPRGTTLAAMKATRSAARAAHYPVNLRLAESFDNGAAVQRPAARVHDHAERDAPAPTSWTRSRSTSTARACRSTRTHRRSHRPPRRDPTWPPAGDREATREVKVTIEPQPGDPGISFTAGEGVTDTIQARLGRAALTQDVVVHAREHGNQNVTHEAIDAAMVRIEQRGLYLDELQTGAVYVHRPGRTLTEADNVLFTTMTMNTQPLHLDAAWSATQPFGQRLVNSMLTLATVVGQSVTQLTQGTIVAQLGLTDVSFPQPLFHGDTLYSETVVLASRLSASRPMPGPPSYPCPWRSAWRRAQPAPRSATCRRRSCRCLGHR